MIDSSENILHTAFFESLNQSKCDTKTLGVLLNKMLNDHPHLFTFYVVDDILKAINKAEPNWNDRYFSEQKIYAKSNFSIERLEHLLKVREKFRRQGHKGYAPNPHAENSQYKPESFAYYTPSNNLRMFVEEGNLLTVRTALSLELKNSKLNSQALRAALAWTKNSIQNLCEVYSEKAFARGFDINRNNWTETYYYTQEVYLETSFTEERFLHMIEVREHLMLRDETSLAPTISNQLAQAPNGAPSSSQTTDNQSTNRPSPPSQGEIDSVLKTVWLIGGAIASLVILLFFTLK
jgi:hypothetical protein